MSNKLILYLDDEENELKSFKEGIKEGADEFEVRTAQTIEEFWSMLEETTPDLFLIDWHLQNSTSEELLKKLQEKYPNIPRIVLTSGGEEGTANRVLELDCDYIAKSTDLDAIEDRINQNIEKAKTGSRKQTQEEDIELERTQHALNELERQKKKIEKGKKEVEEERDRIEEEKKTLLRQKDKLEQEKEGLKKERNWLVDNKKELEAQTGELEKQKNELEAQKNELEKQKNELEAQKNELEKQKNELELQTEELQHDKAFLGRFLNTAKNIVDERLKFPEFADNLLRLLVEYSGCRVGTVVWFAKNEGVLVGREDIPNESIKKYTVKPINVRDIGRLRNIRALAQGAIKHSDGGSTWLTDATIISDFKNDDRFKRVRPAELTNCKHLLMVPLQMDGVARGVILLFDKVDNQCFDRKDIDKVGQFPISDMMSGAADMPFRTYYDKKGILKWILIGLSYLFCQKPWKVKQFLMASFMEFIRLCVVLISILIICIPSYLLIKSTFWPPTKQATAEQAAAEHATVEQAATKQADAETDSNSIAMHILNWVEKLMMMFTFLLFSLGLLVLFEPNYARSLPKWMLSFTRISTLERTILRLVVIVLSIHILGKFLNSGRINSHLELLITTSGVCLVILAAGLFSRFFLHEQEEKDEA